MRVEKVISIESSNSKLISKLAPARCITNSKITSIVEAAIDKNTPTLAQVQRASGKNILIKLLQSWLIYLNETLNLKNPMTPEQIVLAAVMINREYYSLRFADLTVLFNNIISGKYGKRYGSLGIDDLMQLFEKYFDERCEIAATMNNSKDIEHKQNLGDLGTDRISKHRR
jgi:hypothetical protein